MNIIGLSGYARSGKDEAAKVLVEEYGFTRIAFADKLRDFLYALNPVVRVEPVIDPRYLDPVGYEISRVKNVIDQYGWDGYKETIYVDEIRPLLQRLGTEAGRGVLGPNIWIDSALNNLDPEGKYVVTDCRFPNEAEAIRHRHGQIFRVNRAGVGPANDHPSEISLDTWSFDAVITNNGSLEEYREKVREIAKWL